MAAGENFQATISISCHRNVSDILATEASPGAPAIVGFLLPNMPDGIISPNCEHFKATISIVCHHYLSATTSERFPIAPTIVR